VLLVVKNAVYYQAGDKHDDVREWKCPSDFSRLDEAVAANRTTGSIPRLLLLLLLSSPTALLCFSSDETIQKFR